jgi:hypothetical protein
MVQATGLPLIVVITTIGLETHAMRPSTAAALVAAGMASVLIFPMVGFSILDRGSRRAAATGGAAAKPPPTDS